ncbi:MAG TPA: hypothetical protein VGQ95_08350 [Chthoniobacterales bacterium]|nr:hypothetical protein [Chthoniobacterales bacterium]
MTGSILEYLKALAWPVIALIVLASFWTPLHEIGRMAPELIRQSDSITIGSVSLQLSKRVTRHMSDEVRNILPRLEPDDIRELVAYDRAYGAAITYEDQESWTGSSKRLEKFVTLGLLTQMSVKDLEDDQEEKKRRDFAGYKATQLYVRVHTFLINLVPEVISELQLDEPGTQKKKK